MNMERFEMRLDRETLEKIDAWGVEQPELTSRAEAIRRLVDTGLAISGKDGIRISDGEKLILMLMLDLMKHYDADGVTGADFIMKSIYGGHYWALAWKYTGLFHSDVDNPRVVSYVFDILEMWYFIEIGYEKLTKKERKHVEIEAKPFGNYVKFRGFDGNNEIKYHSIMRFLIDELGYFERFEDRDLNAPGSNIDAYRRMRMVFKPMKPKLIGRNLTSPMIIDLLKAKFPLDHQVR